MKGSPKLSFWNRKKVRMYVLYCSPLSGMFRATYYRPQTKFPKVMLLHVSVILSTGGGGGLQAHTQWGGWGSVRVGLQAQARGVSQHVLRQTPPRPQMATAADGTHPTGMHSCIHIYTYFCGWYLVLHLHSNYSLYCWQPKFLMQWQVSHISRHQLWKEI